MDGAFVHVISMQSGASSRWVPTGPTNASDRVLMMSCNTFTTFSTTLHAVGMTTVEEDDAPSTSSSDLTEATRRLGKRRPFKRRRGGRRNGDDADDDDDTGKESVFDVRAVCAWLTSDESGIVVARPKGKKKKNQRGGGEDEGDDDETPREYETADEVWARGMRHARMIRRRCARAVKEQRDVATLRDVRFEDSDGLPAAALTRIHDAFVLYTTRVVSESESRDKATSKLVVELRDGHRVEACVMRHEKGRTTLCVSSQVGCKMGCTFCATGTLGELGNLSAGEILEQLAHASARANVRNVVFMGMGEPLNNYDEVIEACRGMTDPHAFALAPSKITVNTVGVIPRMKTLTRDAPGTCLALSLHAPTQELRQKIVPTATAYKLDALMETLDEYLASGPKMKTMIEYCVLGGVNDSEECARLLGELLFGKEVIVNLIPLNPTDTPAGHVPPKPEAVKKMLEILTQKYKLFTTVRHEMGQDIAGACGQLALKTTTSTGDMEDMMGANKSTSRGVPGVVKASTKSSSSSSSKGGASLVANNTSSSFVKNFVTLEGALMVVGAMSAGMLAYSIYARRRAE